MTELKPCPFCGGEAELCVNLEYENAYVACKNCDAIGKVASSNYNGPDYKYHAISAWNKRYIKQ